MRTWLSRWGITLLAAFGVVLLADAAATSAQAQDVTKVAQVAQAEKRQRTRVAPRVAARPGTEARRKEAINAWTVGLAAGRIEGAPLRFAAELARVVDDGDNMRVLPIITRGIFDNVFDLLHLRGVDAAIVYGDVLDYFKKNPEVSGIERRINYLMNLFPSELHVFVRPEIKSMKDLVGKKVNFNTPGTAAAYSGPIIFDRLGIKVDARFIPHSVVMESMKKSDEFAAVVFVSSKPLGPFLRGKWPEGFKFLPVEYTDKLEYYLPAYLEHKDYPAIIPDGQRITTIAVPAVLAVYDWPRDTDRYRRVSRLVDYIFDRIGKLQKDPGYHPKWKDVSLAGTVPGWTRFKPMQDKLDQLAGGAPIGPAQHKKAVKIDRALARSQAARAAPDDPKEQERLFQQFLEWSRQKR